MGNRKLRIGTQDVDFEKVVPDTQGMDEEMFATIIEKDWAAANYLQFGGILKVFLNVEDIKEWDGFLLDRYEPQYENIVNVCHDCSWGPCDLKDKEGACGLCITGYQARLSLRKSCRGCLSQMTATRDLLDYALRSFGREKQVSMGSMNEVSDVAPSVGILTGICVRNLADLDRALAYAEEQVVKAMMSSYLGSREVVDAESQSFHMGTVLMLAMEIAEIIKISCFGFITAADMKLEDVENFPPADLKMGMGAIDKSKPTIVFAGDNFLPSWFCLKDLKARGAEEEAEICGIGPAGDDIVRFYQPGHIAGPMSKAKELIQTGFGDVVVASEGCFSSDMNMSAAAKEVGSAFIWVGPKGIGTPDRTDDALDDIIRDLVEKKEAVWVRDVEKAGIISARTVIDVRKRRKESSVLPEKTDSAQWIMRRGRGPSSITEQLQSAFALMWGNSPGIVVLLGCGNAGDPDDLGWLGQEFTDRNCIVMTAGCGAADVARGFDEETGQHVFEKYAATTQARNLINCGGCSAICHTMGFFIRYMRPAGGISHYANPAAVANGIYQVMPAVAVIWGALSDRMYTIASALVRMGIAVIAGPKSELDWNRVLSADCDDRSKWWVYHGDTGKRRDIEPVPEHLLVGVETKEDALVMASRLFFRPGGFRDARRSQMDLAIELSMKYSGDMPERWYEWVRADAELPPRHRVRMLKLLREAHGWETDQRRMHKAKHPDGRLLAMKEFASEYGMDQGTFLCNVFDMLPNSTKRRAKE